MKTILFLALLLTLSGCVSQIPQDAGRDFYRQYNRAKEGVHVIPSR